VYGLSAVPVPDNDILYHKKSPNPAIIISNNIIKIELGFKHYL